MATAALNLFPARLLKETRSRCPVCQRACPAQVWKEGEGEGKVFLKRSCPEHGEVSICISSDARFYWLSRGTGANSGTHCGDGLEVCSASDPRPVGTAGRNAHPEKNATCETLSTCLALIEIVDSCNLKCPTCYANSPYTAPQEISARPLEELQHRIDGVIQRKGAIEVLQISGGEPTLHPDFFALVQWIQEHPSIHYLLINTNGVRVAHDPAFALELARVAQRRRVQLYLQFDGIQLEGQHFLRGADLRATRERALAQCAQISLPVTLAMTVTRQNLGHLWSSVEFALEHDQIRGITFQPIFGTGRHPLNQDARLTARINTADIILALVEQSQARLRLEDFTPLPCGDPNCATIGYLLKTPAGISSISQFIDFTQVQGFLRDRIRYSLADLQQCGCDSEPLGAILKELELDERKTFRLFIKPFMDALTWDQDRIDRCCTHVITPDGKLDSFCRYYAERG